MSQAKFDFSDKTVFITGAGGGLGLDAARKFKDSGAFTIAADRNLDKLLQAKDEGIIDQIYCGDLTNNDFQKKVISEVAESTDILINNVGAGFSKTLEETTIDDYNFLWNLNFMTTAIFCQGIMPAMAKRGAGKVINLSTVLADNPLPTLTAYSASKAAVIAFTKSVALQFAPSNVQANVIAPGYIENPKHEEYFQSQHGQNFAERFMPTGQVGSPDAINGAFLFLASDLSQHITGQVVKVDGGYSIW